MNGSETRTVLDIETSVSEVLDSGCEHFASRFYWTLFDRYPELEAFFQAVNMHHQAAMLTMGLQLVVQHHTTPKRSHRDYLRVIGERHTARGIEREHYEAFEEVLLVALAEFHGDRWHDSLADQWRTAVRKAVETMLGQ
jgi:hemoglobin-like flavoprotein